MKGHDSTITITTAEYRPCYVDGKKALFHRWIDKEQPIMKINAFCSNNHIDTILDTFHKKGIIPAEADLTLHKDTYGIVEYADGTVAEVAPTLIRFDDDKLSEYAFSRGHEKGRNVTDNHPVDEFICSECGFTTREFSETVIDEDAEDEYCREFYIKYCPQCGAQIVEGNFEKDGF